MVNPESVKPTPPRRRCILVCQHRSCDRSGAAEVLAAFQKIDIPGVFVSGSECLGQCGSGPTVRITPDNTWYCQVKPSDVEAIAQQHLRNNQPVVALLHPRFHPRSDAYTPS